MELLSGKVFSGILTRWEGRNGRESGFGHYVLTHTEGRTNLGNYVENKGFSTALILRQGSTIRFGHASAARDP